MKYGMFIIASIAMTLVTIIVSVTSYIKNLKQYKIDIVERDKSYREYIKQKRKIYMPKVKSASCIAIS